MAAKKKAAAKQADAQASEAQADGNANVVEEVATQKGGNTYRADMGESLPPQKHPGVE